MGLCAGPCFGVRVPACPDGCATLLRGFVPMFWMALARGAVTMVRRGRFGCAVPWWNAFCRLQFCVCVLHYAGHGRRIGAVAFSSRVLDCAALMGRAGRAMLLSDGLVVMFGSIYGGYARAHSYICVRVLGRLVRHVVTGSVSMFWNIVGTWRLVGRVRVGPYTYVCGRFDWPFVPGGFRRCCGSFCMSIIFLVCFCIYVFRRGAFVRICR